MEDAKKLDLTEEVKKQLEEKAVVAKRDAKVEVIYKGNVFTVARAEWTDVAGKLFIGEGVSRRMFKDKPGLDGIPEDLGETVCKGRALTALIHKVEHRPPLKHARHVTDYFKG